MAERPAVNPLLQFMRRHATDRAVVERAWRTVSLFVDVGAAGRYPLVAEEDLADQGRIEECMDALREGLCTVVDEIRFVSSRDVLATPAHRDIDGYLNHAARSLQANRQRDIEGILAGEAADEFVALFWETLGNRVLLAFVKSHSDFLVSLDFQMSGVVSAVPTLSLLYFVLYAISGQEEKVAEMESFMILTLEVMPIGEPFDLDGTWLVLTA